MSQIITIDDFTTYLNKDVTPAVAQQVVDAVNAYIERRTGRCFGETKTITERLDWSRAVYLGHQDVVTVTSVKSGFPGQEQTTLEAGSYYSNPLGRLTMYGNPTIFTASRGALTDYLEVTYTYGVAPDEVPEDLRLAALGLAAGFYNWASEGNKDIVETQVGSYRVRYAGAVSGNDQSKGTSDANFAVINSYATKRI